MHCVRAIVLLFVASAQTCLAVELSVLVQNVQFIIFAGGTDAEMVDRAEKYGDLLVGLGADIPDVIGLTETFVKSPTDTLVGKIIGTHPHTLRLFPGAPYPEGKLIDSGLTLLSKYPIEAFEFNMFTEASGLDALSAKGILIALIKLPKSYAIVSVTHQNAGGTAAVYTSQLTTCRDAMLGFVARNIPKAWLEYTAVISMGDYNIEADSPTYNEMMTTLAKETEDPHKKLNPGQSGYTIPIRDSERRIDYVFNLKTIDDKGKCSFPSSNVTKYSVDNLVVADSLSDHLGVRATVSIGESAEALTKWTKTDELCNPDDINTAKPLPAQQQDGGSDNARTLPLCSLVLAAVANFAAVLQ